MRIACCLSKSPEDKEIDIISFFVQRVDYFGDKSRNKIVENIEAQKENDNYASIVSDGVYHEQTAELIRKNLQAKSILYAKNVDYGIFRTYCKLDYIFCSLDFVRDFVHYETDFTDEQSREKTFNYLKNRFPDSEIIILAGPLGMIYAGRKENIREATIMPNYRANIVPSKIDLIESFSYAINNNCPLKYSLLFANIAASLRTISIKENFSPTVEQVQNLMEQYVRVKSK